MYKLYKGEFNNIKAELWIEEILKNLEIIIIDGKIMLNLIEIFRVHILIKYKQPK